jgi:hypothetical protein
MLIPGENILVRDGGCQYLFYGHEATLREDLLASTTSSTNRLRKNYCGGHLFSSFLDDYKTVSIRFRAMAVILQGSFP